MSITRICIFTEFWQVRKKMAIALELNHVWKKFHRGEFHDSLRDAIPALLKGLAGFGPRQDELSKKDFWALSDIDFKVEEGERLGIIGHNGAGKSTLLKVLSQIIAPNRGFMKVNGRLRALIEVGAGFHGDLTGRENIYLNGAILGMSRQEIDRNFDSIVDFSGVEAFLDTPVKRYSSGMAARLGFAVAAHLDPDILIVDEVLSVGDTQFQKKCLGKMKDVANTGRTVLFVSHNMAAVRQLCSRAILLKKGELIDDGTPDDVIGRYLNSMSTQADLDLEERTDRLGSGETRITNVLLGTSPEMLGKACYASYGDPLYVRMCFKTQKPLAHAVAAIGFRKEEEHILLINTEIRGETLRNLRERETIDFMIPSLPFAPGKYSLEAEVSSVKGKFYDAISQVANLEVDTSGEYFDLSHGWHSKVLTPFSWTRMDP